MKKSEIKALQKALELPEIQSHINRKKAAWRTRNPSQETIYMWVQHRLAQTLARDLMKVPISVLLKWCETRPFSQDQ